MMNKTKIGAIVLAGGVLVGGILGVMSIEIVEQGHVGVVYNRSHGVEDKTLPESWHLVSPFDRVTEYPIATSTVKVKDFNVQTKDGKPLSITLSYDYAIQADKAPYIFNKFKGQEPEVIESGWLQSRIKKSALNVFSKYSVLEVFQQQGEINAQIQEEFTNMVNEHGFVVDSVTLGAPTPDAQTSQAIQAVVDAQQKLEQLEIEKQQAIVEAEKKVEEAKGQAESEMIKAQGEAEANRIIKESLTSDIVEYKAIEKWNGELPQVTGGATPFVNIDKAE